MHLYAVQLNSVWEDKSANFAQIRALIADAAPLPGSLIVLPEMFATGFSCNLAITAERVAAETEDFLREVASRWQCAVLGGLVVSVSDGLGSNQALAIAPDGRELVRYRKIRPFGLGGESAVHQAGTETVIFPWQDLQVAPLICYDLRFPELARAALAQGAEVLVYIAAWPARRIQHWLTLLQARAIENQAYVVGVNRCGEEPNYTYCGRSVVVDPHGVIIADASDGEKVMHCEIHPAIVQNWRQDFPAVQDFQKGT